VGAFQHFTTLKCFAKNVVVYLLLIVRFLQRYSGNAHRCLDLNGGKVVKGREKREIERARWREKCEQNQCPDIDKERVVSF